MQFPVSNNFTVVVKILKMLINNCGKKKKKGKQIETRQPTSISTDEKVAVYIWQQRIYKEGQDFMNALTI